MQMLKPRSVIVAIAASLVLAAWGATGEPAWRGGGRHARPLGAARLRLIELRKLG
jgi:hypothetical protein